MEKGDLYWVDFDFTGEAQPAFKRPALIVQGDRFNRSAIPSVLVAPLSKSLHLARAPGNVLVKPEESGLKNESVIVVSQIVAINRNRLEDRIGPIDPAVLLMVDNGLKLIFDL